MDLDLSGSDEDAAAMAAAMGFSSFGSHKPPAKKRKFNAATDAFVEGQALEKIDKGGKKGQGSGGNMVKLGKQRVFGQKVENMDKNRQGNEDEIDLELDGDDSEDEIMTLQDAGMRTAKLAEDNEDEGPQYLDTSLPAPTEAEADNGPAYIDTSEDPPIMANSISATEAAEVQARIDALLDSIGSAPAPPPPSNDPNAGPEYKARLLPGPNRNLPNRPPPTFSDRASEVGSIASSISRGGGRGGRGRAGGGGRGEVNERWYEGYYDPSFNYNPWGKLEKARGLKPRGAWLQHPSER